MTNRRALFNWALFDWAQQPYFTLVGVVGFRPYYVSFVAASPVIGQAQIGLVGALAGLIVALLGPFLGSWLGRGNLKAWIVWTSVPFVLSMVGLWWTTPGDPYAVPLALICLLVAATTAEVVITVNNAMLPAIAPPGKLGWHSGMGVALGAIGGLLGVLTVLLLFFLPAEPVLGLSRDTYEPERATGPFSAAWYVLFLLPLLFFYPAKARAKPQLQPVWRDAMQLLRDTWSNRPMFRFMLGRMLVSDALAALQTFIGVVVATTLGWGTAQLLVFALYSMVMLGVGSAVCGHLDSRLGPRRTVLGAAVMQAVGLFGLTAISADSILFFVAVEPVNPGRFLASPAEWLFLAFATLVTFSGGPLISAMRSWLVVVAPPGESARWFGVYAIAGRATAFVAPLAVGGATLAFNDVRAAVPVMLAFLVAGIVAFWMVPDAD